MFRCGHFKGLGSMVQPATDSVAMYISCPKDLSFRQIARRFRGDESGKAGIRLFHPTLAVH